MQAFFSPVSTPGPQAPHSLLLFHSRQAFLVPPGALLAVAAPKRLQVLGPKSRRRRDAPLAPAEPGSSTCQWSPLGQRKLSIKRSLEKPPNHWYFLGQGDKFPFLAAFWFLTSS